MADKNIKIITVRGVVIKGKKVPAFTEATVSASDGRGMINANRAVEATAENKQVVGDMKKAAKK